MIHFYFWFRYRVGRKKIRILQDLQSFPANWQSVPLKRPIYKKKGNIWWSDYEKHCQRHNEREGKVLLPKQLLITKHQYFDYKFKNQTSKSWLNLASVSRQRLNIITSTKHRQQNTDQTSVAKSRRSFNFKILTKLCAQSLNKNLTLWPNFSFQICTKLSSTHF